MFTPRFLDWKSENKPGTTGNVQLFTISFPVSLVYWTRKTPKFWVSNQRRNHKQQLNTDFNRAGAAEVNKSIPVVPFAAWYTNVLVFSLLVHDSMDAGFLRSEVRRQSERGEKRWPLVCVMRDDWYKTYLFCMNVRTINNGIMYSGVLYFQFYFGWMKRWWKVLLHEGVVWMWRVTWRVFFKSFRLFCHCFFYLQNCSWFVLILKAQGENHPQISHL